MENGTPTSSGVDTNFTKIVRKQLKEIADRFMQHLWPLAVYVMKNQAGLHGLPRNDNGFLGPGPININLLQWWCAWSDDYGYGIFHSARLDQTTGEYHLVRRGIDSSGL